MIKICFTIFLFILLFGCQTIHHEQSPQNLLSILQGATDSTSTQINILARAEQDLEVVVSMDQSVLQAPEQKIESIPNNPWKMIQIFIKDLTPDLTYTLSVYEKKVLQDRRQFKVLPKDFKQPRLFIISCTSDSYQELQKKQWKQIQDQKPDMLFLIGDNVYVDISPLKILTDINESDIWSRYVDTRNNLDIYKMQNLIPTFATWDDHDYGVNNGDARFPLKDVSKKVFRLFFPMGENAILTSGPGVASSLKIDTQQFLFLDNRTFRSPLKTNPQTHFGQEQMAWLLQSLKEHKGTTWLISGDQFFGAHHPFESFEGHHPVDFKKVIQDVKKAQKPIVFVSGDRHIAELMKIEKPLLGFETFELTSSGLHSKMYPGATAKHPNRRALFSKDGDSNYLELKIESASSSSVDFETIFWGEDQKIFFQQKYKVAR